MTRRTGAERLTVLSRAWAHPGSETAYVVRAIAAAAERSYRVDLLVPKEPGPAAPDGAFNLVGVGRGEDGGWPTPDRARWPEEAQPDIFLVEHDDPAAIELAASFSPDAALVALTRSNAKPPPQASAILSPLPARADGEQPAGRRDASTGASEPCRSFHVGLHVPINPLAEGRHTGLGFVGYVLVLTDRQGRSPGFHEPLTPLASWIAARFPRDHVIVVEDATASVWRTRALRGLVHLSSRTDLWRLIANARVTVDLAPGPWIGRECVESLLFGTPIVAPARSAAATLCTQGAGCSYETLADLLDGIASLDDEEVREDRRQASRELAQRWYGDPEAFVRRITAALEGVRR